MNEAEKAELFNRDLDALLAGRVPSGDYDGGAMTVAASLAAADFSGESRIREELRGRLAPEERGLFSALFPNRYVLAAAAAAFLVFAMLPVIRRSSVPVTAPVPVIAQSPKPDRIKPAALPPSAEALMPVPKAEIGSRPFSKPDTGLFAAIPMGTMEGEKISQFPIRAAGLPGPIEVTRVREIKDEGGSGFAWETETTLFELRSQPVTMEDLFQVKSI